MESTTHPMTRLLTLLLTIFLTSGTWLHAYTNLVQISTSYKQASDEIRASLAISHLPQSERPNRVSDEIRDSLRTAKVLLRRMLTLDSLKSAKLELCDAELAFTTIRYREALDRAERQARETLLLADSLASLNARARLLNAEAIRLAEVNRGNVERLGKAVARERKRRWVWIGLGAAGGLLLGVL